MTEDIRCAMIADYLAGMKQAELAAKYDCHPTYPAKLAGRLGLHLRCSKRSRMRRRAAMRASWRRRRIKKYFGPNHPGHVHA